MNRLPNKTINQICKMSRKLGLKRTTKVNAKKVICVETGETFESDKVAISKYGSCVRQVLCGKCKTAGGYHWMYYDDYVKQCGEIKE